LEDKVSKIMLEFDRCDVNRNNIIDLVRAAWDVTVVEAVHGRQSVNFFTEGAAGAVHCIGGTSD
jgi:hypothetical protein